MLDKIFSNAYARVTNVIQCSLSDAMQSGYVEHTELMLAVVLILILFLVNWKVCLMNKQWIVDCCSGGFNLFTLSSVCICHVPPVLANKRYQQATREQTQYAPPLSSLCGRRSASRRRADHVWPQCSSRLPRWKRSHDHRCSCLMRKRRGE